MDWNRWFHGRVVSASDYKAGSWVRFPLAVGLPTGYSVLGGTVTSSFGPDWIIGEVIDTYSAGNKLFHPYQVGAFVDYPR